MEPIRPDDDELRAGRNQSDKSPAKAATREKPAPAANSRPRGPDKVKSGAPPKPPGGAGRLVGMICMLLVVVVVGAGLGWQQSQRLAAVEEQLEEADYWARQSKLALARFEGELSETGDNLEQRGSTIEQRLAEQKGQIATANSEIAKLWVIAYERNRPKLAEHEGQLAELTTKIGSQATAISTLAETQNADQSQIASLGEQLAARAVEAKQLNEQDQVFKSELAKLTSAAASAEATIDRRLQRFSQEQKLTIDSLDGRIKSLEGSNGDLASARSRLEKTEARLVNLEQAIKSIDSSRAQLTSRLVRLSEQVDALRTR